jgi:hypothetical protein
MLVLLGVLFFSSFLPGYTLFSNDGPLGRLMSECHRLPERFGGSWEDLNALGFSEGCAWPNFTYALQYALGPVAFSKFYAPIALLILGLGAWTFFRSLRLSPAACVLGSLAAMLNSNYFSAACWGVAAHAIAVGMIFFGLAALQNGAGLRHWLKVALAGAAVGMAILEGADIGALLSLLVAAFAIAQIAFAEPRTARSLLPGLGRLGLVVSVAAVMAGGFIFSTVHSQGQGASAKTSDDTTAREQHWNWATQWSLPKREALSILIPGLFGYRMDALEGGNYWGATGRDLAWDKYFAQGSQGSPPPGYLRFSGGGCYAGVLVVMAALWAFGQSLRGTPSILKPSERKWIWFWGAAALTCLLLAFGRYAPFYQFLYALPYFSTIRNPAKFLHLSALCLVVLFAYGIEGLARLHLAPVANAWRRQSGPGKNPVRCSRYDQFWIIGFVLFLLLACLGWVIYASQRAALAEYLVNVQFARALAEQIADFSISQAGWFVVILSGAVVIFSLVLTGTLAHRRLRPGMLCLGALLVLDLGRANLPWIVYFSYPSKYASNPVLDILRDHPNEHRVATLPIGMAPFEPDNRHLIGLANYWSEFYNVEWTQHLFPYYNIQTLDLVQMRVMPPDMKAFMRALGFRGTPGTERLLPRIWRLTNTRYLLGPAAFLDTLNQEFDQGRQRFRILTRFRILPKPGIEHAVRFEDLTVAPDENGDFALFEFAGALPRAKLFLQWRPVTDADALAEIASPQFEAEHSVLVDAAPSSLKSPDATSAFDPSAAPAVKVLGYTSRDILLEAEPKQTAVLLLNDRFDPGWQVLVDGQPQTLLRCNYIMRGVQLTAGHHRVEFRFRSRSPLGWYTSLACVVLALGFAGATASGRSDAAATPGQDRERSSKAALV